MPPLDNPHDTKKRGIAPLVCSQKSPERPAEPYSTPPSTPVPSPLFPTSLPGNHPLTPSPSLTRSTVSGHCPTFCCDRQGGWMGKRVKSCELHQESIKRNTLRAEPFCDMHTFNASQHPPVASRAGSGTIFRAQGCNLIP